MPEAVKPLLPVSPRQLVGLLAVCVLVAWLLLPSKRDLLERQLRDGQRTRAIATLEGLSNWERRRDPEYYALTELRLRRELLNPKSPIAVRKQITAACAAAEKFQFKSEFNQEFLALLRHVPDVAETREVLRPFLARMPQALRRSLHDTLVARALADAQPVLAARVFAEFWATAPTDESATTEMIRLWRGAGQPAQALAALEAYAKQAGVNLARSAPALARARINLLRELARPAEAYQAAWELASVSDPAARRQMFPLLATTARESGRGTELLPEARRNAEAQPQDEAAWRTLADIALGAGDQSLALVAGQRLVRLRPENQGYHFQLAQLAEWNRQPSLAFDHYLHALRLKEPAAAARLLALNPGLYRDADLAPALAAAADVVDLSKHGLEVARLLVGVGSYQEASLAYQELLRRPGAGVALLKEYGRLLLDLQDYERAQAVFTQAAARAPGDLPVRRALAELSFRQNRYEEAFTRYRQLFMEAPDSATLENFIALAESLGRTADIVAALLRHIAAGGGVTALDYQRLAHFQEMLEDQKTVVGKTLREGLARFPQDHSLRVLLVYLLVEEKQMPEAVRLLSQHNELRKNPEVVQLYLDLLVQSGREKDAEQFLASGIDPKALAAPGVQAMVERIRHPAAAPGGTVVGPDAAPVYVPPPTPAEVARRYHENPRDPERAAAYALQLVDARRAKDAERVLQPFLAAPTPPVMQAAALMFSGLGNFAKAESYQRRYLASQPEERAQALGYLGDILYARGQKTSARQLYQQSLAEFFRAVPSQAKQ